MASVTPGVLVKLLQSMDTDAKVGGEHRSAVLQVIGIVPALPAASGGGSGDPLWPSPQGFYLQLSDSVHSTYVSLSGADADAVLLDRPQLGQLVHVDRLHFAHPVPRAAGLRPVPGSGRPLLVFGSPEPLVAKTSPSHRGFVIQPASPADAGPPPFVPASAFKTNPSPEKDPNCGKRTVFAAKENVVGSGKSASEAAGKRRFSSPAGTRLAVRKINVGEQRDPSPALGWEGKGSSKPSSPALGKAGPRPSSPVPSKCTVPSLVAAAEENRRVAKEPAIVVPSRYRQPSPVGGRRAAASPAGRRSSMSPGRRLSGGLKVSPATGEGGGSKKKVGLVVAGMSKVSEALVGASRSVRKSWDDSTTLNSGPSSEPKEKGGSKNKVNKEAILRTQAAIARRLSDASGGQSTDEEISVYEKPRRRNRIELANESDRPTQLAQKITIHDRKWTDGSIPLDPVSDNLAKLGKDALQRRNMASIAAAEALEEAMATESVIRCLSMFSDLCSSSKAGNPQPAIGRFLSIYDDVLKWKAGVETLAASRNGNAPNDVKPTEQSKPASLWVEAALATDLDVLRLLNDGTGHTLNQKGCEKPVIPAMDPPRTSLSSKRNSLGNPARCHAKVPPGPATNTWTRGCCVGETLDLARALQREMRVWFLKFVEEALDVGFRVFGESSGNGRDNGKVAAVLSQLKRINDWLDGAGRMPEEEALMEKIERLKRKIYGFVISHVGSAFDTSVSLSVST